MEIPRTLCQFSGLIDELTQSLLFALASDNAPAYFSVKLVTDLSLCSILAYLAYTFFALSLIQFCYTARQLFRTMFAPSSPWGELQSRTNSLISHLLIIFWHSTDSTLSNCSFLFADFSCNINNINYLSISKISTHPILCIFLFSFSFIIVGLQLTKNKIILYVSSVLFCFRKIIILKWPMNQLKGIIKANLASSPLDVIFWADPSVQTFQLALLQYQAATMQAKIQIQKRAFGKLQKQKAPKIGLAILCLLDFILSEGYHLSINSIKPNLNIQLCKSHKQKISEESFYFLYHELLTIQERKPFPHSKFPNKEFSLNLQYCQIAVKFIFQLIMSEFVIEYCLLNSNHKKITKIVVHKILQKVWQDLKILNSFIYQNWHKIVQQNQFCFRINQVYQKCIFFAKSAQKLERIKRNCNFERKFQFYKMNLKNNKQIELKMLQKDIEKKKFISLKAIGDSKTYRCQKKLVESCSELHSQRSFDSEDDQLIV